MAGPSVAAAQASCGPADCVTVDTALPGSLLSLREELVLLEREPRDVRWISGCGRGLIPGKFEGIGTFEIMVLAPAQCSQLSQNIFSKLANCKSAQSLK